MSLRGRLYSGRGHPSDEKLLSHYDISANMISYHEHNKHEAGERILQLLGEGKDVHW